MPGAFFGVVDRKITVIERGESERVSGGNSPLVMGSTQIANG
jgi:hypothetical protein